MEQLIRHVSKNSVKTTLLDFIKGSSVAKYEPGGVTQHISSCYIPLDTVKNVCGGLLEKSGLKISVPGFLWVDSPGHEAFTTLRKRGGAISDLAVLIIDINEGFRPQTDESLNFLKQFKTPFVVAATKIDRLPGWNPTKEMCFLDAFENQNQRAQDELEKKLYELVGQLGQRGFPAERFDRLESYTKQIAIVPVSGITGEGVSDLLVILAGVAQKFLKDKLEIHPGEGKGTILEVKEFKGLGTTIDVIVYDGSVKKGDHLLIGSVTQSGDIIESKVKALLKPKPLRDIKTEKDFDYVPEVTAADGVKVSAPGLERVIAGSPLRAVGNEKDIAKAKEQIAKEIEEVEIETDKEGVILKADTLGSLEALVKTLKEKQVPIRKALVGNVSKNDIVEAKTMEDPVIFAFCTKPEDEVNQLAKDNKIAVFCSDVIYKLVEDYEDWKKQAKQREEDSLLEKTTRPGKIRVLVGYVFRESRPAVFGVEVIKGIIKPGYRLKNKAGKIIGEIKELQKEGKGAQEAITGDRVAVSMQDVVVGKYFSEGDTLDTFHTRGELISLKKLKQKLTNEERELLEETEKDSESS